MKLRKYAFTLAPIGTKGTALEHLCQVIWQLDSELRFTDLEQILQMVEAYIEAHVQVMTGLESMIITIFFLHLYGYRTRKRLTIKRLYT